MLPGDQRIDEAAKAHPVLGDREFVAKVVVFVEVPVARDIGQEAKRLERIVADMLSVSEIEAGSLRLNPGEIRLDALFEELVNRAFTPRQISRLEPMITDYGRKLLDDLTDDPVDLVAQFTYPLPIQVILSLIDVPRSESKAKSQTLAR